MAYNPLIKKQLADLPHNLYWQISPKGAEYLKQAVLRLKPANILEIGTSSGYSTLWMSEGLIEAGLTQTSKIYTIESNRPRHDFATQNFIQAGLTDLIVAIKGNAPEAIPLDISFNLAFFDGTKSQTIDFFNAVWPILAINGEILIDNILSHAPEMQPFLDYLSQQKIPFEIIDTDAGLCRICKSE